jgi:methionyl-tRNA formyltransferase
MQCAVVTNKVFESLAQEKEWHFFVRLPSPQELGRSRYIFFPFWSHKVPKEITDKYECVCFHMTDVPYGRGGSPLQNLILRGHTETVISALRMTDEMDAGPVYMKRPLSLEGSAQEIYERAAGIISGMMREIAETEPTPVPHPLAAVPNVLLTPHIGYNTTEASANMLRISIATLEAFTRGERLHVVN